VSGSVLRLQPLADVYDVVKLDPQAPLPVWADARPFCSVTRSVDELSIVCPKSHVPPPMRTGRAWRGLKVLGPLDFSLVGILLAVAAPLAEAGISIFAVSTYDTDYVLVQQPDFDEALAVLGTAGHTIAIPSGREDSAAEVTRTPQQTSS
jgi:hypothetical protein